MTNITARLAQSTPYSWRRDPDVPRFDDTRPLIVFDGVCVFCSRSMQFVATHERASSATHKSVQFTAAQSILGQALFRHFGLETMAFETVLVLSAGKALGKRDAVAEIARQLRWPWSMLRGVTSGVHGVDEWAYDQIAKRRYRMFGKYDQCFVPDATWRGRVIE
jgi:predicted DCC family thiol-disulfide oxidoreductase YuxK